MHGPGNTKYMHKIVLVGAISPHTYMNDRERILRTRERKEY